MTATTTPMAWRHTELSALGLAPLSVRAWLAVVWVAVCVWMGHVIVIEPTRTALDQAQENAQRLSQRMARAEQAMATHTETLAAHQRTISEHTQAAGRLTGLSAQHAWLSSARRHARQRGVQLTALGPVQALTPPTPWRELGDQAVADPLALDWLLSGQGLDFFDVELEASGALGPILDWLHAAQTPTAGGRVAVHWVDIRPQAGAGLQVLAQLRVLGWPSTDEPPTPVWGLGLRSGESTRSDKDRAVGALTWPRPGTDWWQALPLERLALVGVGQLNDRSWAWVIDPTGTLRALGVGSSIGTQGRSVEAIDADGVVLGAVADQPAQRWTWQ